MASNDDSSNDSNHDESSKNSLKSNFLLYSDKLSHHQTTPTFTCSDDNIKILFESFTKDLKKSFQVSANKF